MAGFFTRVELHHSSSSSDYETLHAAMLAAGFYRAITASDGKIYHLPTAEYHCVGQFTLQTVLEAAKVAAAKTSKAFSILVTQPDNAWASCNLPPVK
jgi:hypothetical protein